MGRKLSHLCTLQAVTSVTGIVLCHKLTSVSDGPPRHAGLTARVEARLLPSHSEED
jgi:hypothetical protein